jgi:hypothetical protein
MKVTFVPFHTPQADSFCHSWAMTSSSESGRLRSSLRCWAGGARVGVSERDLLRRLRERLFGEREGEKVGCDGCRGAVEVK